MPSKNPIGYIDIRAFAHATEDLEKVLKALRNILPAELVDSTDFRRTSVTGHHGNPIVLLETRVKEKKAVQATFQNLSSRLSMLDKESLGSEIQQRLEKSNLYIRLSKQDAYSNEVRLGQADPIHIRVHFKKQGPGEIAEVCRELGLIP